MWFSGIFPESKLLKLFIQSEGFSDEFINFFNFFPYSFVIISFLYIRWGIHRTWNKRLFYERCRKKNNTINKNRGDVKNYYIDFIVFFFFIGAIFRQKFFFSVTVFSFLASFQVYKLSFLRYTYVTKIWISSYILIFFYFIRPKM